MKEQADGRSSNPVQVFEVTMDNPEDQDELNRRLRKPGESNQSSMGTRRSDPVPETPKSAVDF